MESTIMNVLKVILALGIIYFIASWMHEGCDEHPWASVCNDVGNHINF
jgi:hypothetical protein